MNEILCSIIIPYYNVPTELVDKCLFSILNQNWEDTCYEIIFVNDGSPLPVNDSTKDIFNRFQHFTFIEQENKGLSAARNIGIIKSQGDYIFFVDPDDYWFENKISDLIPHLKRKEYDIIKFQTAHIHNIEKINHIPKSYTSTTEYNTGCEYMAFHHIIMGACTYCYKRDFIIQNNILMPVGIIHEDEWFLTLAFYKAGKCLFTQIPLYAYVKRDNSIMSFNTPKQWERHIKDLLKIIKNAAELRDRETSSSPKLAAINNRISFLLYVYIYYIVISYSNKEHYNSHLNELKKIHLYPLPPIGNNTTYKLLRLCSPSKNCLKFFIRTINNINKRRVDGKIY